MTYLECPETQQGDTVPACQLTQFIRNFPLTPNRKSIVLMVIAMVSLASNDAIMKSLSEHMPMGQVLVLRGLLLCAVLVAVILVRREALSVSQLSNRWCLIRAVAELFATVLFLGSLAYIPIGVATTLVFTSPLILTAVSGPLFGERVGRWRWFAVFAGFVGVLLITAQPDQQWSLHVLMPLGAALGVAGRDIATRYIPKSIPAASVTLSTAMVVALGAMTTLHVGWTPVGATSLMWAALCAGLIALSFFCYITAIRNGELSLLAPVQYVVILCAVVYGYLLWSEIPTLRTLVGATIVIGAGLLILWRERVHR